VASGNVVAVGIPFVAHVNISKESNMHTNEAFVKKMSTEQVAELMAEAETLGKAHVAALKEQLTRLRG
jgi:hypothetical protein